MASQHWFVEHTGEVELQLRADTLAALFAEAGGALAELMLGENEPRGQAETVHATVRVEASDREALLVAWIDELIFQGETRKAVFTRFDLREVKDQGLEAELHGRAEPVIKTAVKAATYHRLRIAEQCADGTDNHIFSATMILDV
jgi:SHS2 domain-containing protein